MGKVAIAVALSGKLRDKEMIVIDKLNFKEAKTKEAARILNNLKIKGKALLAFSESEKKLRRASRNLEKVKNILTSQLNILDLLDNKNLVLSKESVKYLEDKYKK